MLMMMILFGHSSRFGQHEVEEGTQQRRGRLVTARRSIAHLSTALQLPHVSCRATGIGAERQRKINY